ncbi:MAG: ABC transporter permease [Clostridia bacterium]|jgi:putative ABC transport system permease protein|nr:ABC transporter permease [Clostridia bacterium]NLV34575.1 ABC transporter permease [Clostridiaceae bacterium]
MDVLIGILTNIFEEGFIYGIMAMGVYISYKVMDFPDLSVDGTFPLGMCVTASLISAGADPLLACIVAFIAGSLAGCITGILNVKLKITDLLSGILVMTAMWSVNLVVTKGSAVLPFYNKNTIFNTGLVQILPESVQKYRVLIVAGLMMIIVKILMDLYLKTKSGLLLRAAGDNPQFVTSMSRNPGMMKIMGLAIGNGCTALAGSILSQQNESANITAGTGMVVMSLASVIIGTSIFNKVKFMKATSMAVIGAIIYKMCLVAAMQLGLPTNYLKLLMAVIFTVALVSNNFFSKGRRKQNVQPNRL